ncbi:MAG TPA: glutamate--cysteine ligase [Legionellales bacterium]|nr:glutamate--cysteine ligase [Legionellales bacterium]|tara:strand:+ start:1760 stop:3034 length:1275 start_codon:yes stop_codon:yes gene_type:complete
MTHHALPVVNLQMSQTPSMSFIEKELLKNKVKIEQWFEAQWQHIAPPIMCSVDLRHAGFKLAPVDTNLFPAGFNNLHPSVWPYAVKALKTALTAEAPHAHTILLIPEDHTRNEFYNQSLMALYQLCGQAGFNVRVGSLSLKEPQSIVSTTFKQALTIEPVSRLDDRLVLDDFTPDLIILNNDLSAGIPLILEHLKQPIAPLPELGWAHRLKSKHFTCYEQVVDRFAGDIGLLSWRLKSLFCAVDALDFMTQQKLDDAQIKAQNLFKAIQYHYTSVAINETPFLAVKADNGTYGMGVMMLQENESFLKLNRKQRTKMSTRKGNQAIHQVILQEGVASLERTTAAKVAEPVVYMIGKEVVGGFYRVHDSRGMQDNLNTPGMHFEPLPLIEDEPFITLENQSNRFYAYSVVARLAALAAGFEKEAYR